jgi:hypothetical protein
LAIVLVGANDYGTTPVEFQAAEDGASPVRRFLDRHSRLFKLCYMLFRGTRNPHPEFVIDPERVSQKISRDEIRVGNRAFEMGFERSETPHFLGDVGGGLERNLASIPALAREHGVQLLLLTYASEGHLCGTSSVHVRRATADTGTPLLELRPVLATRRPEDECEELYFPDGHLLPERCRLIAAAVAEKLAGEIEEY